MRILYGRAVTSMRAGVDTRSSRCAQTGPGPNGPRPNGPNGPGPSGRWRRLLCTRWTERAPTQRSPEAIAVDQMDQMGPDPAVAGGDNRLAIAVDQMDEVDPDPAIADCRVKSSRAVS